MNTKVEAKARTIDPRDPAFLGYEEWTGFAGMPGIDRRYFDPHTPAPVAVSPDKVIGRPAVIVPET